MRYTLLLLILIFCFAFQKSKAQQINPNNIGAVKGILRDTAHNYTLKSATVSLFKGDSTLVSYQLSNNYGEFIFKNIPLHTKMYLEVSHVGYELLRKAFLVADAKVPLDLKTLVIKTRDINLKEVEIKIPPISMNGDTLEFNAAAFKLDSNAVVEDLLRKIPNVTLWGDGQITVNGREVKSLLVNGKEFFGGDFKVATQNISKNALEKVQVYSTRNESNPLDSTLTVNLKLKKDKEIGYFGKVGAGYGTDEKYEIDGNVNMFSPKMQLGVVGASNNINKIANNIRSLTTNSTFKGVGTSVEYQSDFRQTGLNQPTVAGAAFTYNFIEKPLYNKKSTLTANYFVQDKDSENLHKTETTTTINGGSKIIDLNTNKTDVGSTNQKFDAGFDLVKQNHRLNVKQAMYLNNGTSENVTQRSAFNDQNILTSTNNTVGKNDYQSKGFSLNANYNLSPNYVVQKKHRLSGLMAKYDLFVDENQNNSSNLTAFRSIDNPTSNRDFDRRYDNKSNSIKQSIDLTLPNLKSLFFGYKRMAGFDLSINNSLDLKNEKDNNQVEDLNTITNNYVRNSYLSNATQVNVVDDAVELKLTKSINKNLANRYSHNWSFNIAAKQRFILQDNQSNRSFQNIKRSYNRFVPEASINYTDFQYGEHFKNYGLSFTTNILIPNLQQLAPLVDSTNVYNIQIGNINLKEAIERVISFNFSHSDQNKKNVLNYNMSGSANFTDNRIVSNVIIDQQNRRTSYLVNANGSKSFQAYGNIRKTYKLKTTELQVGLNGNVNLSKNPTFLNNIFAFSNSFNTNGTLRFNFTYKDKFATEATQTVSTYNAKQAAFNTEYSGSNLASTLSSSYNISKKFTLSSNISYNTSKSAGAKNIDFTIWNASATYRFLKGNNAEFKFSALDILHQNTNIINYGYANSFTLGSQQVLQQYFMTTFSYYPRKFGKTPVKK